MYKCVLAIGTYVYICIWTTQHNNSKWCTSVCCRIVELFELRQIILYPFLCMVSFSVQLGYGAIFGKTGYDV